MSKNEETLIGKIIHEKIPIEWMRYNMFLANNKYKSIPMLVFRVQASCTENLIQNLTNCIESFCGQENWKMFKDPLSRKGNYLITIAELEDLHIKSSVGIMQYNQKDYFGTETFNKHCEYAILDIPMLAQHISETL